MQDESTNHVAKATSQYPVLISCLLIHGHHRTGHPYVHPEVSGRDVGNEGTQRRMLSQPSSPLASMVGQRVSILRCRDVGNEGTQRRTLSQPSSPLASVVEASIVGQKVSILRRRDLGNEGTQRRLLNQPSSPLRPVDRFSEGQDLHPKLLGYGQ